MQRHPAVEASEDWVAALARRRAATEKWWAARSPWARFRARCQVLAWLGHLEDAQCRLDAAWASDARGTRAALMEVD